MRSRALTSRVLVDVLTAGISLERALARTVTGLDDARDRAFVQELCFGVLRWLPRLRFQLSRLLDKPLKTTDADIDCLLLAGLYQILELNTPDHAAVSASVNAAQELGKPWAGKLVNAVLRRAARERETLQALAGLPPAASLAHPKWLLKALQQAWPDDWQAIATANNQRPPLFIRVHRGRVARERYLQLLAAAGLKGTPHAQVESAIRIEPAVTADALPGFAEGLVSVQDAAAQLAAGLLELRPGQRVLDACAAPGGKTAHILETEPQLDTLVAVDNKPERLARLRNGLERLQLTGGCATIECQNADASQPEDWWDGRLFDRILLDAPCTGTGVIRRHPDIKYHRDRAAIETAAATQARLLDALWPLLAPSGKLLYATCSVLPVENSDAIAGFLARQHGARALTIDAPWGRPVAHGRQILPGNSDMDGFFYACLNKQ